MPWCLLPRLLALPLAAALAVAAAGDATGQLEELLSEDQLIEHESDAAFHGDNISLLQVGLRQVRGTAGPRNWNSSSGLEVPGPKLLGWAAQLETRQHQGSYQHLLVTSPNPDGCLTTGSIRPGSCAPHFERLKVTTSGKPVPSMGTALVRVVASSVNPCDWKTFLLTPRTPYIPGTDFAGVVEEVGLFCGFSVGDEVWGISGGTWSEYIVQPCTHLGLKPKNYRFDEAGSLGVVALTGLQALRYAGAPWAATPGPRVLVLGGSGGTGHVAIQLAKALGASEVITTCSPDNFAYVTGLGADRALDYHTQNWWEVLPFGSVDVIYDCASIKGTGDLAYKVLADGGKFVTLLPTSMVSRAVAKTRPSVSSYFFLCNQSMTKHLDMVRTVAEAGLLSVTIDKTYAGLDQVAAAMSSTMEGHNVGKVAITIGSPAR